MSNIAGCTSIECTDKQSSDIQRSLLRPALFRLSELRSNGVFDSILALPYSLSKALTPFVEYTKPLEYVEILRKEFYDYA